MFLQRRLEGAANSEDSMCVRCPRKYILQSPRVGLDPQNALDIKVREVLLQEVHSPPAISIKKFRNPSEPASTSRSDWPVGRGPRNPRVPPDAYMLAITHSPDEPFFKELEAVLDGMPRRR